MLKYKNTMQYSEKAIYSLCRTQHMIYYAWKSYLVTILSIIMLSLAATADMPTWGKTAFLALCGISISFASYPPIYKAKATINGLKGNYPESSFYFYDENIVIKNKTDEKNIEYSVVERIQYDEDYIYLFVSKNQAYMLDNKHFLPDNTKEFISFISEKTGKCAFRSKGKSKLSLRSILMQRN